MSRNSHNSVINETKLPCGNSIYDSHELSNAFNDHFSSIGLKLANNIHANEDNSSHLDYLPLWTKYLQNSCVNMLIL